MNSSTETTTSPKPDETLRTWIEQDDSMLRIRRLSMLGAKPLDKTALLLGLLAFSTFLTIFFAPLLWNGDFGAVAVLGGLIGLYCLILWFVLRSDLYDEERLTIDDDGVVFETVSSSPKRQKRRELGPPQDLQYKAIRTKNTNSGGRIAFWIGGDTVTFQCDNIDQRNEILVRLGEFLKRYEDRPKGLLVPYKTRSFFVPTDDGFVIDLPSPYSRSTLGEKCLAGLPGLFLGGYFWGRFLWYSPNFLRTCFHYQEIFLPEQAIQMLCIFLGTWLVYAVFVVMLPLLLLNGSYWTRWSIRLDRQTGEVTGLRSSLLGWRRRRSPVNRMRVFRKPRGSILRIFWLPNWFNPEPTWERSGIVFDFDGRKFILPCGSEEEADWLLGLLQNTEIEFIDWTG